MENKEKILEEKDGQSLIHEFKKDNLKNAFTPKVVLILVVVVLAGFLTGFMLSSKSNSVSGMKVAGNSNASSMAKGTVIGSNDTSTFKDMAQGVLKAGGVEGEGAFHLVRPGGDSQNVYLTSSSVDLSKLIDKQIKVWGQTQKAQHAGWLMDVGKVEVL